MERTAAEVLPEDAGQHSRAKSNAHRISTPNLWNDLSILGIQFHFAAEELRGRRRTGHQSHRADGDAVDKDILGRNRGAGQILGLDVQAFPIAALTVFGLAGCRAADHAGL